MDWSERTVVVAGRFERAKKADVEALARARGATITRSVEEADLMIAGARPGARFDRARARELEILDEAQVFALFGEESEATPRPTLDARVEALRAIVQEQQERSAAWRALCEVLNDWPEDEELEVGVSYCLHHVLRWPARDRPTQRAWLDRLLERGADPRLRLAGALRASHPQANRDRSVLDALLAAREQMPNVTHLSLNHLRLDADELGSLLGHELLDQIDELDLMYNNIGAEGVEWLLARGRPRALRYLDLRSNAIGADGAHALAEWEALAPLTWLHLYDNDIGDRGVQALAGSAHLSQLEHLSLENNGVTREGIEALAEAPFANTLRVLNLCYNELEGAGTRALANAPAFVSLEELDLGANEIGDEGVSAIAGSAHMNSLRALKIQGNSYEPLVTDAGAAALATSPHLSALEELSLKSNDVTAAGLQALLTSTQLGALRALDVSHSRLDWRELSVFQRIDLPTQLTSLNLCGASGLAGGGDFFARAEAFAGLDALDLSFSDLTAEDLYQLAHNPHLSTLCELQLSYNKIDARAWQALTEVPFTRLRRLSASGMKFGVKQARALVRAPWFAQLEQIVVNNDNERAVATLEAAAASLPVNVIAI